ncbi:hypothetical protein C1646_768746, partial [Rhizophagus diaphanus]
MTRIPEPVWNYFKKSTERKIDQAGTKQHYIVTFKNQYKNKDKEQESSDVGDNNTEDNVSNEKEEIDIAIARAFYT